MGQHITFEENGVSGQGYLSLPESGSGPAVLVIQEWWGLVGHITDVVDRFAAAGFVAYAPDLYHGQAAAEPDTAKKLAMELKLDLAGKELTSAASHLLTLPETSTSHVGVIGFCMGGSLAIWSGTLSEKISATVGFYPGASWERHAPHWANYNGKTAIIHCAQGDGTSSAPGIQEAIREITGAGGSAIAYDYADTQHAFFNDDRPEVYAPIAAALAWERTLQFFFEHLR
jgi:carboxymethylenebutenolidase